MSPIRRPHRTPRQTAASSAPSIAPSVATSSATATNLANPVTYTSLSSASNRPMTFATLTKPYPLPPVANSASSDVIPAWQPLPPYYLQGLPTADQYTAPIPPLSPPRTRKSPPPPPTPISLMSHRRAMYGGVSYATPAFLVPGAGGVGYDMVYLAPLPSAGSYGPPIPPTLPTFLAPSFPAAEPNSASSTTFAYPVVGQGADEEMTRFFRSPTSTSDIAPLPPSADQLTISVGPAPTAQAASSPALLSANLQPPRLQGWLPADERPEPPLGSATSATFGAFGQSMQGGMGQAGQVGMPFMAPLLSYAPMTGSDTTVPMSAASEQWTGMAETASGSSAGPAPSGRSWTAALKGGEGEVDPSRWDALEGQGWHSAAPGQGGTGFSRVLEQGPRSVRGGGGVRSRGSSEAPRRGVKTGDAARVQCTACEATFSRLGDLPRHWATKHSDVKQHTCPHCGKSFARKDKLLPHVRELVCLRPKQIKKPQSKKPQSRESGPAME